MTADRPRHLALVGADARDVVDERVDEWREVLDPAHVDEGNLDAVARLAAVRLVLDAALEQAAHVATRPATYVAAATALISGLTPAEIAHQMADERAKLIRSLVASIRVHTTPPAVVPDTPRKARLRVAHAWRLTAVRQLHQRTTVQRWDGARRVDVDVCEHCLELATSAAASVRRELDLIADVPPAAVWPCRTSGLTGVTR